MKPALVAWNERLWRMETWTDEEGMVSRVHGEDKEHHGHSAWGIDVFQTTGLIRGMFH